MQFSKNIEVLNRLMTHICRDIAAQSRIEPGETAFVIIGASVDSWVVEHPLASELRESGASVVVEPIAKPDSQSWGQTSGLLIKVDLLGLGVQYGETFHESFFGARKTKRTLTASVSFEATDVRSHVVRGSGSLSRTSVDTVLVDAIPALESASVQSTHGTIPDQESLDRYLEPFVIVGATGVAVYLFFHIRS
jgi:hypothetical protein